LRPLLADFNDELARLSLVERPNPFYLGDGSTAAESIESDSGYSSPQHRQTATSTLPLTTSSSATSSMSAETAAMHVTPQTMAPVAGARNVGVPPPTSDLMYGTGVVASAAYQFIPYAPVQQVLPSAFPGPVMPHTRNFRPRYASPNRDVRPALASRGNSRSTSRGRIGVPSANYRQPICHPSPIAPAVAMASVPLSRTPLAREQPAWPFGDVDEFPILLSAAGGLVASQGASCQLTSSPSSSLTGRAASADVSFDW
jgi:hypothetical protein